MKLRIGYQKERKPLDDISDDWTVKQLEDAIREKFEFGKNTRIGLYLGPERVNNEKNDRVSDIGVVSSDLLLVYIESGPDNPFLNTFFGGNGELAMRMFNFCELNDAINVRRTCKTAYRQSSTKYLDLYYWKKEFIRMFGEDQLPEKDDKEPAQYRKALFKKLRDQEKAAYLESIQASARQDAMNHYHPRTIEDDDHVSPLNVPRRDPSGFDPLRVFNDNFYGQEVYRPRNPDQFVPNAPRIYPHFHGDPTARPRQDPDMPQGPFSNQDPFGNQGPFNNQDPFGNQGPFNNQDPFGNRGPFSNQDPFNGGNRGRFGNNGRGPFGNGNQFI